MIVWQTDAPSQGSVRYGLTLGDVIYDAGEAYNFTPRYFTPYRPTFPPAQGAATSRSAKSLW